jgi:hypothetical protein
MPTKFVNVGSVAAGASAAICTRRFDEENQMVVFQKSGHMSFVDCGLPYHLSNNIESQDDLLLVTLHSAIILMLLFD